MLVTGSSASRTLSTIDFAIEFPLEVKKIVEPRTFVRKKKLHKKETKADFKIRFPKKLR